MQLPQVIYKPHCRNGVRNGVFKLLLRTPLGNGSSTYREVLTGRSNREKKRHLPFSCGVRDPMFSLESRQKLKLKCEVQFALEINHVLNPLLLEI